jgi:hypothetical protein
MNMPMDARRWNIKLQKTFLDAVKWLWETYVKFSRSVRLHINTGIFLLAYVLSSPLFGVAHTKGLVFLAILSWLAAVYMDLEVLYKRVARTLIGKAFLAVGLVATTIMAHAISSIVVNGVTGVDPSKFPYTVTLLSLMCIPFFVLSASIPLFFLLLIVGPIAVLLITPDRGALSFMMGKDSSGEKKPLYGASIIITVISWAVFTGFIFQIEKLSTPRYDAVMTELAEGFIFNFETYSHSPCQINANEKVGFISESEVLVARKQNNAVTFEVRPCVKHADLKTSIAGAAISH